jgi:hypothetical protein
MKVFAKVSTSCCVALLLLLAQALAAPERARAASSKNSADVPVPTTNIVMIRKDGEAIDPTTGQLFKSPGKDSRYKGKYAGYDSYMDYIFADLKKFCANQPPPCKLLFYFHGGLNGQEDSVGRAKRLTETIKRQGVYPIFVNWDSSLVSTWWDHLAHVHKGLWQDKLYFPIVPYFAAVDEVRSIAEAPSAWVAEVRHTFPHEQAAGAAVLQTYQELVQANKSSKELFKAHKIDRDGSLDVTDLLEGSWLEDDRKSGEINRARAKLLYSWWSKLLAPPLLIQAAGTGAWDMMQRRTAMLFRTEAEFRGIPREAVEESREVDLPKDIEQKTAEQKKTEQKTTLELAKQYDTGAAFARFIDRFRGELLTSFCDKAPAPCDCEKKESSLPAAEKSAEDVKPDIPKAHNEAPAVSCENKLEITLVGHSMGTIIIDRLLRYAPDLQVKNIVFMGAATTVEDYRDTVDAYLDRHREDKNGGTNMYHLVLHPLAEVTEQGIFDLAPRGSLLIWIDNYFTDPPSPLGRRVGRFANVVPELRFTNEKTRPNVHLKVFRVGEHFRCWNPQRHGDFGDFPFWDKRFWDPQERTDEASAIPRLGEGCSYRKD